MPVRQLDIKPGKKQFVSIAIVSFILLIGSGWAIVNGAEEGVSSPSFLGSYGTAVIIFEMITALLLLAQFLRTGRFTYAFLSMAYLWVALISPVQIILLTESISVVSAFHAGGTEASWLWTFWHIGFPIIIAVALSLNGSEPVVTHRPVFWAWYLYSAEIVIVALVLWLTLSGWVAFPQVVSNDNHYSHVLTEVIGPLVAFACALALLMVVFKGRFKTDIYAWLAVAMLAALCESIVAVYSGSRFSVGWYVARILSLISSSSVFIALLLNTMTLYLRVIEQNRELREIASIDKLSQLANRREFDERLKDEVKRAIRERKETSLIMLDIDFFKTFNDSYGHPAGDRCITQVAASIRKFISRPADLAARYGGEEFAVLLPNTSEQAAFELAEVIRTNIASTPFQLDDGDHVTVTASFGVASLNPTSTADGSELIKSADAALYLAKRSGRNRVQRPTQSWHFERQCQESKVEGHPELLRKH
ncbi:sensor domain-containing diguanylate cyclase [Alteromonas sp. ASW11-130]|uniref:sensor domain-containing diguanylate cyclase n=1 Tax=Alteromonas sp. ASW11-130 TaxID=3015775 RepID=UPI0022419D08|nr:sensor domain-containing diguanylate cyclase [Alteromonas sp. ASW11-130]MCW8090528.1 GGDEF domain-containing protein [Alteromonas sp. ASW11-130]